MILWSALALSLSACSSPGDKQEVRRDTTMSRDTPGSGSAAAKPVAAPIDTTLRFIATAGKDSTVIRLVIHGGIVSGQMNWLPYRKDSRKGELTGTLKGDTLQAKWTFMQEGMKDTLNLQFKLQQDQLVQKPLVLNTGTGRDQTNQAAGYTLLYQPVK